MSDKYLTKVIAASLLGDGCVTLPKEYKTCIYTTVKTSDHDDYIDWLKERLEILTKVTTCRIQPKNTPNAKEQINLKTRAHPLYTKFRERMYGTGHKVVDPHYLTLMDWEFMAIWFQEDGTLNTRFRKNCYEMQAGIATQCFSYGDHLVLARAIQEKLDIPAHIRASSSKSGMRQYQLVFRTKFIAKLLDNMEPYIVPSFKYKCSYDKLLAAGKDEEIVRSVEESTELDRNDLTI